MSKAILFWQKDVGSSFYLSRAGTKVYSGVSSELLTPELRRLIDDRARRLRGKLNGAPYAEIIGRVSGYEMIKGDNPEECTGYCDYWSRVIAFNGGGIKTVYHELGHALQAEEGLFEKQTGLLSEEVYIEQQCETVAYYLYNGIYPEHPLPPERFDSYFTRRSLEFLKGYYGDWRQDDIL